MDKNKKAIYKITALYIGLFSILIIYLAYFTAIKQKQIAVNPHNTRLNNIEKEVIRGNIYDTNKNLLATTVNDVRKYPEGSMYAHIIGYSQRGKTGVEALANTELLYPNYTIASLFKNAFLNEKFEGRDIMLTLDTRYQQAIAKAMKDKKGAVVVIEPSTGKIKAMYSNPGFDPNNINEDWETLTQDTKNSPLVNRAIQGLYPPGSIYKTVVTLFYMKEHLHEYMDLEYLCQGQVATEDYTIQCYNKTAHGVVDIKKAFYLSCNAYFVELSQKLPLKNFAKFNETLGFNQNLPFDIAHSKSRFTLTETDTDFEKAVTYIGQGRTLVTPFHMAMLAATIANDGVMMKPYLIDYSMNKKGKIKTKYLPQYQKAIIEETIAKNLQDLMLSVVNEGTGIKLKNSHITIGGKTGTAQNESQKDHSWFIGFAKTKDIKTQQIAFAVVVENGGEGAKALNVTQNILQVYESIHTQ